MITGIVYNLFGSKVDRTAKIRGLPKIKRSRVGAHGEVGRHNRILDSQIGERCRIEKHCKIRSSELGSNIAIGSYTWLTNVAMGRFSYLASRVNLNNVKMGSFCSIGPNVLNHLGNHPTRTFVSTHPAFYTPDAPTDSFVEKESFPSYGGTITIGNDVWIGADVLLMDGISIGDGAVVAARSIVTKDVPPYAIVGGVPARLIRYRFNEEIVQELESFQWWNKEIEWIRSNADNFRDITQFINLLRGR